MVISVDEVRSGLCLWAILVFSVLQVITGQSTMSTDTGNGSIFETQTTQTICLPEPPICPHPMDPANGSFMLLFSPNCEPYLNLTCAPGFKRTIDFVFCVNGKWRPSITEDDVLCAASCGNPPQIAYADAFLLPDSSDDIPTVNYSAAIVYEHETELLYQCLYYNSLSPSLQRTLCSDGHWEPFPSLECTKTANNCNGEIIGLAVLGMFCGIETILIIAMLILCFRSRCVSGKDDTSMAVPNKKHSGNTYSGQRHSTPKTSMEDTPVYPPPRPPARTDSAVIGRDDSSYYTYADVPAENGNNRNAQNINVDDTPGVQRNKSIPQYLEIMS